MPPMPPTRCTDLIISSSAQSGGIWHQGIENFGWRVLKLNTRHRYLVEYIYEVKCVTTLGWEHVRPFLVERLR